LTNRAFFVGSDGRPHPPWRLLLFILVSGVCVVFVVISLRPVLETVEQFTGLAGTQEAIGLTLALLLAHWVTLRTFDKQPWSYVWLDPAAARPRVLLSGGLLGAVPIGVITALLVVVGLLVVRTAQDGPWLKVALQTLVLLLPAALSEELLSRGYLFAAMKEWLGARAALVVTSAGFGLLHVFNPNVSALSIVLVTLAGFYLAIVLLATKSLYAAWMAHFAWNWVMAALLHVPVSGLQLARPDYEILDAGPDWITGGQWGPEGGAAAGLGMLGGLAYLYWRTRFSVFSSRPSNPPTVTEAENQELRAEN
jgi:membrane protease YdiL (CAAX protease family)